MNDTLEALEESKQDLLNLFDYVCPKASGGRYDTRQINAFEEAKEKLIEYGLLEEVDFKQYED